MNSYYDNILIQYATGLKMKFTVISDLSNYIEYINTHFPFAGERIDFSKLDYTKFRDSDNQNISCDAAGFFNELLNERICNQNDDIVYIGDSSTNNGYELSFKEMLKIIPFLVSEIPQHHYFLFKDKKKIVYISFENEIAFGINNDKHR